MSNGMSATNLRKHHLALQIIETTQYVKVAWVEETEALCFLVTTRSHDDDDNIREFTVDMTTNNLIVKEKA